MNDAPPFAGPRDIRKDGTGTVSYGLDDGMLVEFYEEPEHMEYLSKQTGHPIFRMRIMTRIVQPGNTKTVWVHPTKGITYEMVVDPESGEYHTNWDILEVCENGDAPEPTKYVKAWNRFMRKGVSAETGHPIEQWGTVSRSYAESLKAMHVHTVEALAGLTDTAAQSIMGALKYRDLARAYLDDRVKTEILAKEQERANAAEERAQQQAKQIEALQQHVMALQARINNTAGGQGPAPMMQNPAQVGAELATYNKTEGARQMSVKDSKKKHKIPVEDQAA